MKETYLKQKQKTIQSEGFSEREREREICAGNWEMKEKEERSLKLGLEYPNSWRERNEE